MPSWPNSKSGESYNWLVEGSAADSGAQDRCPPYMDDVDYNGFDTETDLLCYFGFRLFRYVASSGTDTGRKFLGCAYEDENRYKFTHWVDDEWNPELKLALKRLWASIKERDEPKTFEVLTEISAAKKLMEEEALKFKDDLLELMFTVQCKHADVHAQDLHDITRLKKWLMLPCGVVVTLAAVLIAMIFNKALF